jgi:hypothetical protein
MQDLAWAYSLMLRICGAGIAIDALERLVNRRKYRDSGPYGWVVLRQRFARSPPPLRRVADGLFGGTARLVAVLVLRVVCVGVVAINPPGAPAFSWALTLLVSTQLYLAVRTSPFATIGSDSITLIVCGGAWLATVLGRTPATWRAGLWFVAAQASLAYLVGGVSKLMAPKWRSGLAVVEVVSTYSCGNPRLFSFLRARPGLARVLSWSLMLWETTFPVVLVLPDRPALALLGAGLLFHLTTAALMGLNLFVFAFASTYAAIWAVRP